MASATLNAPSGSTGLDNVDQSIAVGNVWTLSSNTVNETRVQVAHGDLKAFSTDLIGPQVTITGVATFGTFSSSPTRRENTLFQVVNNLSHRAGAHALARRRRLPLQRRHHHLPADVPRQLHVLVDGELPDRQLQRLRADVRQSGRHPDEPEPRHLRAGRMARRLAADAEPRPALRPAVPRDDQHRHQQRLAAGRLRLGADRLAGLRRPRRRRRVLRSRAAARRRQRAAVGGQHHRCHPTAPAAGVRHPAVAGRRAGVSEHPARPPALDHPRLDHDDGQGPAERLLEAGQRRGRACARREPRAHRRLPVLPRREPADVDQPERADLRGGRHQQRLPAGARST